MDNYSSPVFYYYSICVSWKEWSSIRFISCWGTFLDRPEANKDPQYATIKQLYDSATGAIDMKLNFTNLDKKRQKRRKEMIKQRKQLKKQNKTVFPFWTL